jgi:ribosomal-protein-alanine N-acetyltransferase
MVLFGRLQPPRTDLEINTGRLFLRPPMLQDFESWARLRTDSRAFLQPWEPIWPNDDLTRAAFKRRLRRYSEEIDRDEAYPFYVFLADRLTLVGGLTLTNVRRGAAAMASVGYWMGAAHAGQGIMTEAVRSVSRHAFGPLRLKRLEAACLPENAASLRLLEKVGFQREGYAREYLCINGVWRDHILHALLDGDAATRTVAPSVA